MAGRPGSWLLSPEEATVEGFATWLARLQKERLATPPRWLSTEHLPPLVEGFYERDYLHPLFGTVKSA